MTQLLGMGLVWRLDSLARSLKQLIETIERFGARRRPALSLTEAIDATTAGGKLVFNIFTALAEFERGVISERTLASLQAARTHGRKDGRPLALKPKDLAVAKAMHHRPARRRRGGPAASEVVAGAMANVAWSRIVHLPDGAQPDTIDDAELGHLLGRGQEK